MSVFKYQRRTRMSILEWINTLSAAVVDGRAPKKYMAAPWTCHQNPCYFCVLWLVEAYSPMLPAVWKMSRKEGDFHNPHFLLAHLQARLWIPARIVLFRWQLGKRTDYLDSFRIWSWRFKILWGCTLANPAQYSCCERCLVVFSLENSNKKASHVLQMGVYSQAKPF